MTLILKWQDPLAPRPIDRGFSEDARRLRAALQKATDFTNSVSISEPREAVIEELLSAFLHASAENWDGYGAPAANWSSFVNAYVLIRKLPASVPIPEVAVDTDGEMALEWDYGPRRVLSVRIGRDGTIHYAGLLGHSTFHGLEIPQETIPEAISKAIERISRAVI